MPDMTDELTWLLCETISGDVIAELPLDGSTVSKRLSDAVDATWTFGPTDKRTPKNWSTLIEMAATMIVAVHRGLPIQAWPITKFDKSPSAPVIGGPDLAGVLSRVFVRDYEAYNTDEAMICAEIANQVIGPEFNFAVRAYHSGKLKDVYYDGTADLSIRAILDEYKASDPSIDFACDVEWVPGLENQRVLKVLRIGSDIGRADPDMVFDSSMFADYTDAGSFSEGSGATRVWGVADGSGSARPMEGPFDSPDIARKGPWESRESFATAEDEDDLNTRGRRTLAGRKDGSQALDVVCTLSAAPQLVRDWDVADEVTCIIDPDETNPAGSEVTAVVIGWDLDVAANTIVPIFKTGDGPMKTRPTRDGTEQLWATIDELRAWRQAMRSSQGVLNSGTITKDGGIKIEGEGSIVSENGAGGTRIKDGVIEVRDSPLDPWRPAESAWIDPIKADISSKSSIVVSPTDDANGPGKAGDTWYRTDGSDHVTSWWMHDGADWIPQKVSGTMLAADAINGKVITGATLQTDAASNVGVKVTTPGLEAYGLPGQMVDAFSSIQAAFAMAVDAAGNTYTYSWTDSNGAGVSTIRRFNPAGAQTLKFDTAGLPGGIAVTGAGTIFVTDVAGNLVRRFNTSGAQTLSFSTTDRPWSIVLHPTGEIGVLTSTTVGGFAAKVRQFSSTGSAINTPFAVDTTGFGEAIPLAIDATGNYYVGSGAIRKYSPTGTLLQPPITGTGYVYGLAVDSVGNIFASDFLGYRIRRFNPAGAPTLDMSSAGQLAAVVLDSSGYVYGTDVTNKVVRKFTQSRERTVLIDSNNGLASAARLYVPAGVDADLIETQVVTAKRGQQLQLINLADPFDPRDAVPKAYADIKVWGSISRNVVNPLTHGAETPITYTAANVSAATVSGGVLADTDGLIVPVDGLYVATPVASFAAVVATGSRILVIKVNGITRGSYALPVTAGATGYPIPCMFELKAGEKISYSLYQSSGGSINTHNQSFPGIKITRAG